MSAVPREVTGMTGYDIYDYPKRLECAMRWLEKHPRLTTGTKQLLRDFLRTLQAEGIRSGRLYKYVYFLVVPLILLGKEPCEATVGDLMDAVGRIDRATFRRSGQERPYSEATRHDMKLFLRRFYRWLVSTGRVTLDLQWFRVREHGLRGKLPEDVLTPDEVKSLIEAASNSRDRAFVSALYEGGVRIGELLPLRVKDVTFDQHGAILVVNGKTGYRRVRLIGTTPLLTAWLNEHPRRRDPDAFVWCMRGGRAEYPIAHGSVRDLLRELAAKTGLRKRVNPHNFRHSRATHLANHLTEAQMNGYFGWIQGSDMSRVYVHLSGRDIDAAIFRLNGMAVDEQKPLDQMRVLHCGRCGEQNASTAIYCGRCCGPLTAEAAKALIRRDQAFQQVGSMMETLTEDPRFRDLVAELLQTKRSPVVELSGDGRANPPIPAAITPVVKQATS